MDARERQAFRLPERDYFDAAEMRAKDANGDAAVNVVRTQEGEGVGVHAADQGVYRRARQRRRHVRMLPRQRAACRERVTVLG